VGSARAPVVALIAVVVALVLPGSATAAGDQTAKVVGHRGGFLSSKAPQNSYAAFAWLSARGHAIEGDARMTRDGRFVMFHDPGIGRTCTGKKRNRIERMTYRQVMRMRCHDGRRLTTLHQVLSLLRTRPGSTLWLESKHRHGQSRRKAIAQNRSMARSVRAAGVSRRVIFQDRKPSLLPAFRSEIPGARTAYLLFTRPTALHVARAVSLRAGVLSYRAAYSSPGINRLAAERGLHVHNWVARTPEQAAALLAAGAHSVSADDPVMLVARWPRPPAPPEDPAPPAPTTP